MSTAILRTATGATAILPGSWISMPREGVWTAVVEIGEDAAPTGQVLIDLATDAGSVVTFAGFVDHGLDWQGRQRLFIVGGAGGLGITAPALLPAREWLGGATPIPARELADDILGTAGETLSPSSAATLAALTLPRWVRLDATPAAHALSRLARRMGLSWRVLDTGEVWLGVDTFPTVPDAAAGFLEDRDGILVVDKAAPEAATLRPGITILGRRIERVRYAIDDGAPRVELHARNDGDDFAAAVRRAQRPTPFGLVYEAKVGARRSDGTLDLLVDDAEILELRGVPFRSFTGAHETVKVGTAVLLAFAGGREDRPYAFGQAQDLDAARAVARVGDTVDCGTIGGYVVISGVSYPVIMVHTPPNPPAAVDPLPGQTTVGGIITSGSAEIQIR